MTTAALGPAEAIRALSGELHDALRQLLDTTPREDPTLLDKMRKLSTGLGRQLTNARKRAVAEQAAEKPAEPKPVTTAPASKPAARPAKPTVTTPAAKPKATDTPKRPEPATPTKPAAVSPSTTRTTPASRTPRPTSARPGGSMLTVPLSSSRWPLPRWLWPVLLVALLLGVLAVLAGVGWALVGGAVVGGAALLGRARWPRFASSIRLKIKP